MVSHKNQRGRATSQPLGSIGHRWRRLWLGVAVAIAGVTLSLLVFWQLSARERHLAEMRFQYNSERRIEAIQREVSERLGVVDELAAFFSGSQLVTRTEFETFSKSLIQKHKGVQSLGWAPRVRDTQRRSFEQAVRDRGFPKFEITEQDEGGRFVAAGKRDNYYPVLFVEDFRENQTLFGFDLGSNTSCRQAIQESTTTGRSAATICEPLDYIENERNQLYVVKSAKNEDENLAIHPAGQLAGHGFILGTFTVGAIIETALDLFSQIGIDMYIFAPSETGGEKVVYTRPSPLHALDMAKEPALPPTELASSGLHHSGEIEVANHRCRVVCVPMESYLSRQQTWGPTAALLSGLVITALLVGYLTLLTGRAARVEQLVAERTRALHESEQRFRRLIDNAGDAFFLHDTNGKILDLNKRACETLGYSREELLSMTVRDIDKGYVPDTDQSRWKRRLEEYPVTFEGVHRRKDGTTFPVEIRLSPLEYMGQRLMLGLARDVTERNRLQQTLRDDEQKLLAILNQTFQFIGLLTPSGIVMEVNKTALAFSGISVESVRGKPFWETPWWAHSTELQEELRLAIRKAAQGDFIRMEVTHLAANGDLHWVDFSLKPVQNDAGEVVFLIPEGRDITDRKRQDEALHKEQRLLREMLDMHERDRKLVAYEIHDGLAQQLTGALYKFQSIDRLRDRDPDGAQEMFNEAIRMLREAMGETRRLISGLRPPILDESGIVAAVNYLISEHQERGGPEIEFVHPLEFSRLAPPLESTVFRVVQECLTNACRYSQSEKVRVELRQTNEQVHVEFQDWGIGFDPTQVGSGQCGLQGIRERARLMGGIATVQSAPRQGVHIIVEFPLFPPIEGDGTKN